MSDETLLYRNSGGDQHASEQLITHLATQQLSRTSALKHDAEQRVPSASALFPYATVVPSITQYFDALDLCRGCTVNKQLYQLLSPTAHNLQLQLPSLLRRSSSFRGPALAWTGSRWAPPNLQFRRLLLKIEWSSLALLEHLDLSNALYHLNGPEVDDILIRIRDAKLNSLQSLSITSYASGRLPQCWLDELNQNATSSSLTELHVDGPHRTPRFITWLQHSFVLIQQLTALSLPPMNYDAENIETLAQLTQLKRLKLPYVPSGPNNAPAHTTALRKVLTLSLTDLHFKHHYMPQGLVDDLCQHATLQMLTLELCTFGSVESERNLSYTTSLTSLSVVQPQVTRAVYDLEPSTLTTLTLLPSIASLGAPWLPVNGASQLQSLHLSTAHGVDIDNVYFSDICKLSALTSLTLQTGAEIRDNQLADICQNLRSLVSLKLPDRTDLTRAGMQKLKLMKQLTQFTLGTSPRIGAAGLLEIAALCNLASLEVVAGDTYGISMADIAQLLKSCTQIHTLKIRYASGLPAAMISVDVSEAFAKLSRLILYNDEHVRRVQTRSSSGTSERRTFILESNSYTLIKLAAIKSLTHICYYLNCSHDISDELIEAYVAGRIANNYPVDVQLQIQCIDPY